MIRNRSFVLLWLVNVTSALALELFTVTILVTIFEQTSSTLQAAGAMAARSLPAFLLGPIAGVLVDRFRRKNVLIVMDVVRLLMVLGAVYILQGGGDIPVLTIYIVLAGLAAADTFHQPARMSLIPSLVTQADLVRANSVIFVSRMVFLALSYTFGGWLVQNIPLQQISLFVVALFAISIVAGLLISVAKRASRNQDAADRESVWQSFVSGLRYLSQHPIARPLTIMETIEHVPHGIWTGALMLAFTTLALNGDSTDWGYQVTGYFSGMIVGSLGAFAINNWLSRYPGRVIVSTAAIAGVMTLLFSQTPTVLAATILAFMFGPPFALRDVAQDALLQSTVEEGQLGRVYSTREMLRSAVFMFSGLFFAWLSDRVDIRSIYVAGGIMYLLTGVYALSIKAVRESKIENSAEPATT